MFFPERWVDRALLELKRASGDISGIIGRRHSARVAKCFVKAIA